MKTTSDKPVTLISGASSGIGRALALRFAEAGHRLSICARSESELELLSKEMYQRFHTESFFKKTDVTLSEECRQWVEETADRFGRIDVLINNAGISMRAPLLKADLNVIQKVMDVNFWGTVYCTKYALPYIIERKGSIIGISSIAGYRGLPERTGYCSSKFAVNGFLESLRTELLPTGVHILTACPGFTRSNIRNTALTADGRAQGESPRDEAEMMSAEAVAEAIFRAYENRKKTLILSSLGKMTVWMNKFFNGWMDKKVYENFLKEEHK